MDSEAPKRERELDNAGDAIPGSVTAPPKPKRRRSASAASHGGATLKPLLSSLGALSKGQLIALVGDLVRSGVASASDVQRCIPAADVSPALERCRKLVAGIKRAFPRYGNNGDSFCWNRYVLYLKPACVRWRRLIKKRLLNS
eukprot:SAG31_NODE_904_length_11120_cov_76.575084_14_plen_143_part_00